MKKILLLFCLLVSAIQSFSQQFSQYNTGTVYDSFENPSQASFIPDSSKHYAFNFFLPAINFDSYLAGDVQATVKNRAFKGTYNNADLVLDYSKFNQANINTNFYFIMFKAYTSLKGDVEIGISAQSKVEGRGVLTDQSIALFNGIKDFKNDLYTDKLNDRYYVQLYHQVGFSYRERINKQFAVGVKLNALLGVKYDNVSIDGSRLYFDRANDNATLYLHGNHHSSYIPGSFSSHDLLPTLRNPGASISIGASYKTRGGINIQGNIKDFGFIAWSNLSTVYNFNSSIPINNISGSNRENNIFSKINSTLKSSAKTEGFVTPTDGRAEISASKSYYLDYNNTIKYTPTVIVSKELFYTGFTGAFINQVRYKDYSISINAFYDDLKLFRLGSQFMIKSPNAEFFIGSEKLMQTINMVSSATGNQDAVNKVGNFTGASFYIGFAVKFGPIIEHPMNATSIPNGEKAFLGRLYNRLFKTAQ